MSFGNLGPEFPRLAARLSQLPGPDVAAAAKRVVDGALEKNGVSVPDTDPSAVERLVWSLDDTVWKLQEEVEKGTASQVAYNQAFRQARAANGLLDLLNGHYGRAVYEAAHALYSDEEAVLELIGSEAPGGNGSA